MIYDGNNNSNNWDYHEIQKKKLGKKKLQNDSNPMNILLRFEANWNSKRYEIEIIIAINEVYIAFRMFCACVRMCLSVSMAPISIKKVIGRGGL